MKQCIKLSLFIIFAALLHNNAIKAADVLCIPNGNKTECCFLSQAPSTQQTVHTPYDHFLIVSLCIEHADSIQVPGNKSLSLRTNLLKMQLNAYSPKCDRLLHSFPPPVPDTHYYVFGLRKIII
ncbi:hypothetical protein Bache_1301 [Bacteroides helcogenes P 36-108]|uniref:Uncharacterized protein n=1 Tax=Bacteroides helcogenes (strain ATCC 35417 / DSM 20613 / JCM 6297 / CCUG 15421 / P 36-108) TaxID=693979 RepID=E6SU07_BACT6|nr:hypothetical protein Bache_1301 [Bacteroides helcogenes P 36-108]